MADRHSTRRPRARTAETHSRPKSPELPPRSAGPLPSNADAHRELLSELKAMVWRLTVAYCTCVTVQAALERQMADHDGDFACCLRSGVSGPVSRQVERLHSLVNRLGGTLSRSPIT